MPTRGDERVVIADMSAWARAHHPRVREDWSAALRERRIATCSIVTLELLYSTRGGEDFDRWHADLARLHEVPVTPSVTRSAERALGALAHTGALHHRSVTLPDLLIAACAAEAGVGVLHYDEDFDRLAAVLDFESRWIAPRGSIS